jgi:hypothetical protein
MTGTATESARLARFSWEQLPRSNSSGGKAPATAPNLKAGGNPLLDTLVRAFTVEDIPADVFRARLLRHGFFEVESGGLFGEDRYAQAEQIANVAGNHVHLNVAWDDLIRGR